MTSYHESRMMDPLSTSLKLLLDHQSCIVPATTCALLVLVYVLYVKGSKNDDDGYDESPRARREREGTTTTVSYTHLRAHERRGIAPGSKICKHCKECIRCSTECTKALF